MRWISRRVPRHFVEGNASLHDGLGKETKPKGKTTRSHGTPQRQTPVPPAPRSQGIRLNLYREQFEPITVLCEVPKELFSQSVVPRRGLSDASSANSSQKLDITLPPALPPGQVGALPPKSGKGRMSFAISPRSRPRCL